MLREQDDIAQVVKVQRRAVVQDEGNHRNTREDRQPSAQNGGKLIKKRRQLGVSREKEVLSHLFWLRQGANQLQHQHQLQQEL